jgi:hypothetical protein
VQERLAEVVGRAGCRERADHVRGHARRIDGGSLSAVTELGVEITQAYFALHSGTSAPSPRPPVSSATASQAEPATDVSLGPASARRSRVNVSSPSPCRTDRVCPTAASTRLVTTKRATTARTAALRLPREGPQLRCRSPRRRPRRRRRDYSAPNYCWRPKPSEGTRSGTLDRVSHRRLGLWTAPAREPREFALLSA